MYKIFGFAQYIKPGAKVPGVRKGSASAARRYEAFLRRKARSKVAVPRPERRRVSTTAAPKPRDEAPVIRVVPVCNVQAVVIQQAVLCTAAPPSHNNNNLEKPSMSTFRYNPFPDAVPDALVAGMLQHQADLTAARKAVKNHRRTLATLARKTGKVAVLRPGAGFVNAPYRVRQAIKRLEAAERKLASLEAVEIKAVKAVAPAAAATRKAPKARKGGGKPQESRSLKLLRRAKKAAAVVSTADRRAHAAECLARPNQVRSLAPIKPNPNRAVDIWQRYEPGMPYRGTGSVSHGCSAAQRAERAQDKAVVSKKAAAAAFKKAETERYSVSYTRLWRRVDAGLIPYLGVGHGKPKPKKDSKGGR
jgi:hypothetical protein